MASTTCIAHAHQIRAIDIGEPQRKLYIEPKESPVPQPTKRERDVPAAPVPAPEAVPELEPA
jgi:hypothetical protein